jgi:hypothetical protein
VVRPGELVEVAVLAECQYAVGKPRAATSSLILEEFLFYLFYFFVVNIN